MLIYVFQVSTLAEKSVLSLSAYKLEIAQPTTATKVLKSWKANLPLVNLVLQIKKFLTIKLLPALKVM